MDKTQGKDFSEGSVKRHIISLAIPMTVAQLVHMAYNLVDRIYIGHLSETDSLTLTALGLTFPLITFISAFTNLFGMGGAPLCSIARGTGDKKRAEKILGNTFIMLCLTSVVLMLFCYFFMKPILYLFGASADSFPIARDYLLIYLIGTPAAMLSTGMNGFINCQGFAKTGMLTTLIGAALNIILDPIFIFAFDLGVTGAAAATVISQLVSAVWVLLFLCGKRTELKLKKESFLLSARILKEIIGLGLAGFVMSASTGLVQAACNSTLKAFGGDLYVGIMTVLSSLRDFLFLPASGVTSGAQPVIGFNYGAKRYDRIKQSIRFSTVVTVIYIMLAWMLLLIFPTFFIRLFNSDAELVASGVGASNIYFFGFVFMALQIAGQSTFIGMGLSKHAIFFSMLRKVIIVVPLTLILPHIGGLGADGVFLAEPISNLLGGLACYITMLITLRRLFAKNRDKG